MLVQTIGLYPLNNIDVSIIHHQDDRKAAAHIASALQRSGVSVWVPPKSLVEGWIEVKEVFELANSSRILIYLISPSAFEQHWVSCETSAAFEVERRRTSLTILPVVIKRSKNIRDIIPIKFRNRVITDLTEGDLDENISSLAKYIRRILSKRKLFVSYSHYDESVVKGIVSSLSRRKNLAIWSDWKNLQAGSIIRRGIESGIADADFLIAVLSHNVIDTLQGWIGFELDQAYERERKRNEKNSYFVIPVLTEKNLSIPGWLSTKVYVDMTKDFDEGIRNIVNSVYVDIPLE